MTLTLVLTAGSPGASEGRGLVIGSRAGLVGEGAIGAPDYYKLSSEKLNAISSLSVDATIVAGVTTSSSVIPATSFLIVDALNYIPALATLPAISSFFTNALEYNVASATLPAASILSVDARIYKPAFAELSATSALACNTKLYKPASALLSCTSTLAADASGAGTNSAVFSLTSVLSSTTQIALVGRAILNLTSTISVFATLPFASATLGASSDLNALVFIRWPSATTLSFSSSVSVDTLIKGQISAGATLAPTSTLSCATVQRLAVQFVLPLNSSFFSDSILRGNIFASANISSTTALSCVTIQRMLSTPSLAATSNLIVAAVQRWSARAQCDAALILQASVSQKWLSVAKLASVSEFIANANATSAGDQPIILNSTSTLHVETIFVRLERHWRRHLTATGSAGLPKQIRGVKNRVTLSGNVS